jgi:hypothetical protein
MIQLLVHKRSYAAHSPDIRLSSKAVQKLKGKKTECADW